MNIKLSFTPVSQGAFDLLVFVLDAERTLHEVDDAQVRAHVDRAAALFREKALKREYFATLPEGAPARALVAYWSPSLKSWNLWENVKTFTARGLRLAIPHIKLHERGQMGRIGLRLLGQQKELPTG